MAKYKKEEANVWIQPIMTGYKMACCDCGLVHKLDFKIEENRVEFKIDRDYRATSAMRKNNNWEYYAQKFNTDCFVVAICNASIYQKKPHNWNKLLKTAKCKNGGTINEIKVINASKLHFIQTNNFDDFIKHGGIATIMHPIFNLHSCFVEPIKNDKIKVINSWLGSNEIIISPSELRQFLPKEPNNKLYLLCGLAKN